MGKYRMALRPSYRRATSSCSTLLNRASAAFAGTVATRAYPHDRLVFLLSQQEDSVCMTACAVHSTTPRLHVLTMDYIKHHIAGLK
jgi:hypothetical protein